MTLPYTDDAEQIRNEIDADLWSEGLPKKGVLMSYSREEFEQAFLNQYTDFERFENGEYMDDFLQHFYLGWQASRQEGEPIGFLQSSGVSQLSGGHPAKLYPIGATPSPFESSTLVYTHPAIPAKQAVSVPGDEYIRALQDLVIKQGEMLSAIVNIVKGPPAENSLHSTHDVVEGVRKLNALVWGGDKEVFVLRKQAEAIDYVLSDIEIMLWHGVEFVAVSNIEYYANTLRAEADAEGDTNED